MIVIGAADTNQLATQLQAAAATGITVIACDPLIQNSERVDCSIAVDSVDVGELQAESLPRRTPPAALRAAPPACRRGRPR